MLQRHTHSWDDNVSNRKILPRMQHPYRSVYTCTMPNILNPLKSALPSRCDTTRERILDAAFAEIQRQGFQAASISAILAETGLTKGALYHHFPGKKELGLAVVDERVAAALRAYILDALLDMAEHPPLDTLLEALHTARGGSEEAVRLGCPLNNLMQEMSGLDDDFRAHLQAIVTCWQERVATLLLRAQEQNTIAPTLDCHATALFIVAAWEGAASIAKNLQSTQAFTTAIDQLITYVQQLRCPPKSPIESPIF